MLADPRGLTAPGAAPARPHAAPAQLAALVGRSTAGRRALDGAGGAGVLAVQAGLAVGLVGRAVGVGVGLAVGVAPEEPRVVVVGGFLHPLLCDRRGPRPPLK